MFISKSRWGIYYLYYLDGKGNRQKISTKCRYKAEALKFLQSFRSSEVDKKRLAHRTTISIFKTKFIDYARHNLSSGTVVIYEAAFKHLEKLAGDIPLSNITPEHFDIYKTKRIEMKVKPVTINMELRSLKAAFNTAFRWRLIQNNPFNKLTLMSVPQVSPIFFKREDFQKLIKVISERWLKEIVFFAVLTGLRIGEIINLRWEKVDLERRVISIESSPTFKTKQGKRRTVPLNDTAFYILQEKQKNELNNNLVFTLKGNQITVSWLTHRFKKYVVDAKLNERLHFHSLRHTFASWLVQDGVSLYAVKELLGHSDMKTTQVYSHLQPESLHKEVNKISILMN